MSDFSIRLAAFIFLLNGMSYSVEVFGAESLSNEANPALIEIITLKGSLCAPLAYRSKLYCYGDANVLYILDARGK